MRACLHQCVQRPGEKAGSFIPALDELSEHCDFGAAGEEHIRDRMVVGIQDKELSRKQLTSDLTLVLTIQTVRQSEEVAAQVSLQGDAAATVQEGRSKNKNTNWKPQRKQGNSNAGRKWGETEKKCERCDKSQHRWGDEKCPASKATCRACHKMGHWARVCRSGRPVNEVTETEKVEQISYFLASAWNTKDKSEAWTVVLRVDSVPAEFKIDTGADVNVVNEDTFHTLKQKKTLQPSDLPPDSPRKELLRLGCLNVTVGYKGKDYMSKMYVVHGHKVNLLSHTLSVEMNLVRRVDEISTNANKQQQPYG